ncbi:AraC family transcriptional regulator [Xanthobacter sp. DSM 24535]|uniref:helix-turn-helix domain-containing protein n=1 Tax=Roseixanthobacter psychrophilus TaxID=3119917 RepID=UPI00372CB70C
MSLHMSSLFDGRAKAVSGDIIPLVHAEGSVFRSIADFDFSFAPGVQMPREGNANHLSLRLPHMQLVIALSSDTTGTPATLRVVEVQRSTIAGPADQHAREDASSAAGGYETASRTAATHDGVVQLLSRALAAAEIGTGEFGGVYADAVRLAIVTRMLSLDAPQVPALKTDPEPVPAAPRARSGLPKWRLKRVEAYIDANLGESVSLADMAEAAGLSRMHFAAQFRIATGQRPHEYLMSRRIERACQMLLETKESVVQVALGVGFQTQAHFTTVFRRFVGETPYRWRSANRARA